MLTLAIIPACEAGGGTGCQNPASRGIVKAKGGAAGSEYTGEAPLCHHDARLGVSSGLPGHV